MPCNDQKTGQKVKGSKKVAKDEWDTPDDVCFRKQQLERQDTSMAYCKVQHDKDMFFVPARFFCMCYLLLQAVLSVSWCCTSFVRSCISFG